MKNCKQGTFIGFAAVFISVLIIGCSGGNNLNGTWELEENYPTADGYSLRSPSIVFKGKKFAITEYPCYGWGIDRDISNFQTKLYWTGPYWGNYLSFISKDLHGFYVDDERIGQEFSVEKLELIETLPRKADPRIDNDWDGEEHKMYRFVSNGTYSVSDGKIEFLFSDGSISVLSFSNTENTMTIERDRFIRKR
jgi:hypothetical protein